MTFLDAYKSDMEEKDMILHPICVVPPERHYDSYQELVNDIKWFEESRAYFYKLHPEYKPNTGYITIRA